MLIENFLEKSRYNIKVNANLFFVRKNNKVTLPKNITTDLAYLIGLIQGDGHLKTNERRIGLTMKDKGMISYVCKILEEHFSYSPTIYKKIDKKMLWEIVINSLVIFEFLRINFDLPIGKKKGKQHLSNLIKNDKENLMAWLAGFVDSDGHITNYKSLEIVQSSKEILEELANILLKHYNASYRLKYNKANDGYYLYFNKNNFLKFSDKLSKFMQNNDKLAKMGPTGIEPVASALYSPKTSQS